MLKHNGELVEQQYVSGTIGYPDEFSLRPPDEDKLRKLAEGTGGKFNPAPADILKGDERHADVERELWPWLLLLATFVFVADVAARRWPEKEEGGSAARDSFAATTEMIEVARATRRS